VTAITNDAGSGMDELQMATLPDDDDPLVIRLPVSDSKSERKVKTPFSPKVPGPKYSFRNCEGKFELRPDRP